jgi:hypothetical protein
MNTSRLKKIEKLLIPKKQNSNVALVNLRDGTANVDGKRMSLVEYEEFRKTNIISVTIIDDIGVMTNEYKSNTQD